MKIFFSKRGAFTVLLIVAAACGPLRNVSAQEEGAVMKDQQKNQNAAGQCGLPLNDEELKKILPTEQFRVLRQNGTELPFANVYWNNKRAGIYVDPITGEPLFSSNEKFDSGTGWPSFSAPIKKEVVVEKKDKSQGKIRNEVRAKKSNSHLGHVFPDGPKPTGLRYCINSAALRFIPVEDLEKEGYAEYLKLFAKDKEGRGPAGKTQIATFGAGCFWGVQSAFDGLKGAIKTSVGYMGGSLKNPTYKDVCTNKTGHAEVVQVEYDPLVISYGQLLEAFWQIHDPTTLNRQGPDIGSQYRSVIFFYSPEQEKIAKQAIEALERSQVHKGKIITELTQAKEFYPAEEYHQKYFEKQGRNLSCHIPSR